MPAFEYDVYGRSYSIEYDEPPQHYPDTWLHRLKRRLGLCCYATLCPRRAKIKASIQPQDGDGAPSKSKRGEPLPAHEVKLCRRHSGQLLLDAARMLEQGTFVDEFGVRHFRRESRG